MFEQVVRGNEAVLGEELMQVDTIVISASSGMRSES